MLVRIKNNRDRNLAYLDEVEDKWPPRRAFLFLVICSILGWISVLPLVYAIAA
jgi:hypothetical protein